MKKINIYIIFAFVALLASSCLNDQTEEAGFRYPNLVVMEDPDLTATYFEDYSFDPQLGTLEGVDGNDTIPFAESDYDNYTYEYLFYLTPGGYDTVSMVVSRERVLSMQMDLEPASSKYFLLLRVTDKKTEITQTFKWDILVLSVLGRGILVAHTEDETSTDIDLLMTKEYNDSFEDEDEDILHKGIYSAANSGTKLPDVIDQLTYTKYGLYALAKNKTLYKANPITYALEIDNNSDHFFFEPNAYKITSVLDYFASYLFIINDGIAYWSSGGKPFGPRDEVTYPYELKNAFVTRFYGNTYFGYVPMVSYDEKNNQFVGVKYDGGAVVEFPAPADGDDWAFNPRALPADMELVAGGRRDNYRWSMLMRSKVTNEFFIYRMATNTSREITGDYIFDMSNCPDLDQATAFEFSEAGDEFYYAVGNELRVAILNTEAPTATVSYALPPGENISQILIHIRVSGVTTWSETVNDEGETVPVYTDSRNKVITVASYNGTQGFLRTLPIQYLGAGGIAEEKYVKTYGGFGRITSIALRY